MVIGFTHRAGSFFGRQISQRIRAMLRRSHRRNGKLQRDAMYAEVCENRVLLAGNPLILPGTAGNDAFMLDYSVPGFVTATVSTDGGSVTPLGTYTTAVDLEVQGMAGADSVGILGSTGADIFTVQNTGLTINGAGLTLSSIESLAITGGAGNDTYRLNADAALGSITLDDSSGARDTIDMSLTTISDVSVNLNLATAQVVNANLSLTLSSATSFEGVIGGSGNDTLTGNALANIITGNQGDDILIGGLGHDTYRFNAAASAEADSVIELDGGGTDTLDFSGLTTAVDVNLGTTAGQTVHTNRTLTLNSATAFENIFGGSGNDTLQGNVGANAFNGGRGNDTLTGGAGNDLYVFGTALSAEADAIVESATDSGIDTLNFSSVLTAIALNLGVTTSQAVHLNRSLTLSSATSVENVISGSGNDTLAGNSLNNTLNAGAGFDRLNGGLGSDVLIGGLNHDTYVFATAGSAEADSVIELEGQGTDTLDFSALTTALDVNLGTTASQTVHTNRTLTLNSATAFENILGGSGSDTLQGNDGANAINGGRGNDTLTGGVGNDLYVFGTALSAEADAIVESATDSGIDTLNFSSVSTAIALNLGVTTSQAVHLNRNLTLSSATSVENVISGSGNDTLIGNSLNNTLDARAGFDRLSGGFGSDVLIGGLNHDTYEFATAASAEADSVIELDGGGTDTLDFSGLTTAVDVNLGTTAGQTVHTNRTLTLNSATAFENILGGSGNDTLQGNVGANAINGGRGNDTLTGGAGNDLYVFGTAVSAEADAIVESAIDSGIDTLNFSSVSTAVALDLGVTASQSVHLNRTLTLSSATSVENVIGGTSNNQLRGNAAANILVGNVAADQLSGLGDRDILIGGLGADSILGGDDDDILIGGRTTSDANIANLISLRTVWISAASYTDRVTTLRAGTGSPVVSLKAQINVLDDSGAVDTLTGGIGVDWYFKAIDDVISGLGAGESVDML